MLLLRCVLLPRWLLVESEETLQKASPLLLLVQLAVYLLVVALYPLNLWTGQMVMLQVICLHTIYAAAPRGPAWGEVGMAVLVTLGTLLVYALTVTQRLKSVLDMAVYTALFLCVVGYALQQRDVERRAMFIAFRTTQSNATRTRQQKMVLNNILVKVVPPYAVSIVRRKATVETRATPKPLHDLIAIEVLFNQQASSSDSPPGDARDLFAEINGIEDILASLGGETLLSLVNVLGDSVQIAGPLRGPAHRRRIKQKVDAANIRRSTTNGPTHCEDLAAAGGTGGRFDTACKTSKFDHQLSLLVGKQHKEDQMMLQCLAQALRFTSEMMHRFPEGCTMAINAGSGFAAVVGNQPPQFSVLGVAPRLAKAVTKAAPGRGGGIYICPDFYTLLQCYPGVDQLLAEVNLGIAPPTTWRIRGAGVQQMRLLYSATRGEQHEVAASK